MNFNTDKMVSWEAAKAGFILGIATKLGMDVSGYGEMAVNPNSGYTYLWLEDYPFTLYMPINCDLVKTDIVALWSNPETGEEINKELEEDTTLDDLYAWVKSLENSTEED